MNEMSRILNSIVERYTSSLPSQVGFKLPKLKKIDNSKDTKKIKLPKLKKIV